MGVISTEFLRIAEGLHHLDPVRSYPARAARIVADLARATAFRIEIERGEQRKLDSTPPPPTSASALSLPLRHGRQRFGTIHLYGPNGLPRLDASDLKLVRWGARALARGLAYADRMNKSEPQARQRGRDVHARMEQTSLTRREKEVVARLVSGASTRTIAEHTGLTVATVHTYLKRVYSKLGVHSRVELVARMVGTVGSEPPPAPSVVPPLPVVPASPRLPS